MGNFDRDWVNALSGWWKSPRFDCTQGMLQAKWKLVMPVKTGIQVRFRFKFKTAWLPPQ